MSEDEKVPLRGSSPPPYHEAAAYPKVQRPLSLRHHFSLRSLLPFVAYCICGISLVFGIIHTLDTYSSVESFDSEKFEAGLASCAARTQFPTRIEPKDRKENPRWNPVSGQNETIVLRNATLFDGEEFLAHPMDIVFSKGLIVSVSPAASGASLITNAKEINLYGAHVTPGLVDMHSHHLVDTWPASAATSDTNEMHPDFGPLTPFVRALDSMKAYDVATARIASGGVTSSLIIPGSANIMGGEGAVVKNAMRPGPRGEFVVEEMLLEHGLPEGEPRSRYMKMACGENPKSVYGHSRMGNVFVLRKWLARAKELVARQDAWCEAAARAGSTTERMRRLVTEKGGFPEELELDSTVGMLRGRVAMHNHCYEPEDMETMLRVSHEFGFRVRAFHHAIEAWQVPEMLKEYGENLTIATFAEFSLYKEEAYDPSLFAGKILAEHGVPVAYKSDHAIADTSAQYLLLQAAVGHSFGLPADKALKAVTSVPAAAIDIDHRVGYARSGFDADLVVWDSHPLSVGAAPRQVYIDGVATLDPVKVEESFAHVVRGADAGRGDGPPSVRAVLPAREREAFCEASRRPDRVLWFTGLSRTFMDDVPALRSLMLGKQFTDNEELHLVIDSGEVVCLGTADSCGGIGSLYQRQDDIFRVNLTNGHVTRGLTTVTSALGLAEVSLDPETGDGEANVVKPQDAKDAANIDYAKYAVALGGKQVVAKAFSRARLGGVTRAIQPPATKGGLITGVSTGLRTGVESTLLNGGLFQDDVALHVRLGSDAKVNEGAVSMAVERLRGLLKDGGKQLEQTEDADVASPWALVANGTLPLIITATSNHDIQQVILLKRDYQRVNAVIMGGSEAPLFARELAEAKIPVILSATRPAPDTWAARSSLPGPPLSRSSADVLTEAGVFFAVSVTPELGYSPLADSRIQSLALEASWVAKYAGLSERKALALVSSNVEDILGLEESKDIVVWEGNPLHSGTPVLSFQWQNGKLHLSSCWPNDVDE